MLMSAALLCCSCCSTTKEDDCVSGGGVPSELCTDASAEWAGRGLGGLIEGSVERMQGW